MEPFDTLFAYENDVTQALLDFLEENPVPAALGPLGHNLATRTAWHTRITQPDWDSSEFTFFPNWGLDTCREQLETSKETYRAFLKALTPEQAAGQISYRDSFGDPYTAVVGDLLQHVIIHGAHHRGQAAMKIREAGLTPPSTDFYTWKS